MPIKIAIHGAAGRMGKRLVALAAQDANFHVAAAIESRQHPALGSDAGVLAGVGSIGVILHDKLDSPVDVVIDFSVPSAAMGIVSACRERNPYREL